MTTMKDFETILIDTLLYFYGKEYSEDIKEQVENDPFEVACNLLSDIESIDMVNTDLSFRDNGDFEADGRKEYIAYKRQQERDAWRVGD